MFMSTDITQNLFYKLEVHYLSKAAELILGDPAPCIVL
jgi:hypothetical protein